MTLVRPMEDDDVVAVLEDRLGREDFGPDDSLSAIVNALITELKCLAFFFKSMTMTG
jgi:hypothetical protein